MTRADIALRPIAPEDLGFLRSVYASTRTEELAPVPWTEAQKRAFLDHQFDAQHQHYQTHYTGASFDVILHEGRPCGRLYVARWLREIRIIDIALLPESRGRGIGGELLREILGEADRSGRSVTIHVERNNPALALYERLGFRLQEDKGVYLFLERPSAPGA